jgi:glycosyltransferase involved in cell wall biosynthesis
MINIAFLIDEIEAPTGGAEGQLLTLLSGLDRKRFSPFLLTLRSTAWLRSQKFPFPVVELDRHGGPLPQPIGNILAIARFCRRTNIDILQSFFVDSNIRGTIGARLARSPVVIASRRNMGYWQSRLDRAQLRFFRYWTDYYIANSHAVAAFAVRNEQIRPERMKVIYNGIDLAKFQHIDVELRSRQRRLWNIAESDVLVGTVANLRPVKNIASLIRAAATLLEEFPQLRFVVVGDGPERSRLEELIHGLALEDRFSLPGTVYDIVPCLAAFDLAVLPSLSEGFSNSLLEYMAGGLPIVVSAVGGNTEAVGHEEEGLIFPAGDIRELEAALRRLLSDRILAARLAASARRKAFALYDRASHIRQHEDFYEFSVAQARRQSASPSRR